jgi:pimeloyl-ACP methyl ester carboxylesterase
LRGRVPLLSLTIAEAPAPEILRTMGEYRHYLAFRKMTEAYFRSFQAGETAAIEQMIDFYGGVGTFSSWPDRVREYAARTTPVNLLDWASAYGFELTPALLATVEAPTLVFWGQASHPAAKRANELLGQCIPNAVVATIAGASQFMISTHAKEVAGMIAQQVARTDRNGRSAAELHQ